MPDIHQRLKFLKRHTELLSKREGQIAQLNDRFSFYRMAVFIGGIAASMLLYFFVPQISSLLLLTTLIVFTMVVIRHRRVEKSLLRHRISGNIKRRQIARLTLDWDLLPASDIKVPSDHPFAVDLDITGSRSLFRLLNLSISEEGSKRLSNWLLDTEPDWREAQQRQDYVAEITRLPGFRDRLLATFRLSATTQLDGQQLLQGLSGPSFLPLIRRLLPLLVALGAGTIFFFVMGNYAGWPPYWGLTLTVYIVVYFFNQKTTNHMFSNAIFLEEDIPKLRSLLLYLEDYPFRKDSNLARLCQPFKQAGRRPSQQLKGLKWTLAGIGISMNPLARFVVNIALPWDFYFAARLEKHRAALKEDLPVWLETWAQLEALLSLGNFAWLNPGSVFPEILSQEKITPVLAAKSLGHPLIPATERVNNSFDFHELGEMMLITGSNMAGKSTFLKTVGMSQVLASAGGAVLAEQYQTVNFSMFASIKVSDSVTDGFSYFYAEVRRLKALLDRLADDSRQPLLLLIDEIFRGTNNRERYTGSKAYIKALAGRNGIGAISTHDLELTSLEKNIPQLRNYHFRENVANGEMVFDYRLQPGPCPTTNALVIMRLEGLPVDDEPGA